MGDLEWIALAAGLFGLLIGSFLNVCVHRMPRDLSVVKPRSFCPACGTTISWYDNIPLISYLLLGGKCRQCQANIPWRYPLVELSTGVLFSVAVFRYGIEPEALKFCIFAALIVGLIFMDFEERILADEMTLGGMVFGFALSLFLPMPHFIAHFLFPSAWREAYLSLLESLIGGLPPAIGLWLLGELYYRLRGREGLGLGDVKMIAMVGAFYGLQGAILTLMIGSLAGSVLGLAFIFLAGKDAATYELPFGSFLGVGALIAPLVFIQSGTGGVVPW
jgi:leader peptidase (prepilin peptidase)/N-methyltransferase